MGFEHAAVPAVDPGLAIADVPVAQDLVQGVPHRHFFPIDAAAVIEHVEHVHVRGKDVIVGELVFLGAALETVREVRGRVARDLAAVEVQALAEPEVHEPLNQWEVDAAGAADVAGITGLAHQLAGPLENARHPALADEHVMRLLRQHETRRACQRIERAFGQRQQLRLAVAVGKHREREEVQPRVDRFVEGLEHAWRVVVAAAALEQGLGLVATVAAEIRVQQVHHGPEVTALLHVDLEEVPQVVQARTMGAKRTLLLDAGRLRVALDHDEPSQLVPELPRHLLPHRVALEVAEADAPIVRRLGHEDAPAILGQLHVVEVRPAGGVHADGGAQVHLMTVLEPRRPHVAPPVEIRGLPVLEGPLKTLVARQVDVVRDAFAGDH